LFHHRGHEGHQGEDMNGFFFVSLLSFVVSQRSGVPRC